MLPDFKLSLRCNNQITITRQNVIKRRERYESVDSTLRLSKEAINTYVDNQADKNNLKTAYSKALRHNYILPPDRVSPLRLDLTNRFQHTKTKNKRDKLGYGKPPKIKYFSRRSGQKIRETGSIVDRLCGSQTERCRVVTLTLPSSETSAFEALSNYSGYAVNRLFQIVRRDYSDAQWFYVYEHQKRGALHLHICIYHDDADTSNQIGAKLCAKWIDILNDISRFTGIDMLFSRGFGRKCEPHEIQLDNQAMRLGCGAYFSKYASKNSGKYGDDINSQNARKYPPSSFWGRSRQLAKMCDEQSFLFRHEGIEDEMADMYEKEIEDILSHYNPVLSHSFAFKKEIELSKEYGNGTLTICEGYSKVIYLSPKDYKDLLHYVRYLYKDSRTTIIKERSKVSSSHNTIYDNIPKENEDF